MSGFRPAIATVCVSGMLDQKLRAIAAAGFHEIEIFEPDLIASPHSPREIRTMLDDLGLRCVLYQPFRDFEGLPEPWRTRTFDRAERKFDLMAELGADRILVCSSCDPEASGDFDAIAADFHVLGERAAARGILVGYEALAWGRHVYDHRQVWDIVQRTNHPSVGILLDSFHSLARGIPVESLREIDPAKIVFVQLADAPRLDMGLLFWSRHFRSMPGQGDLPVADYVAELLQLGYDGPLSLEIFNDRFRATSPVLVATDGMRSLVALHDAASRLVAAPAPIPAVTGIKGVAFVEFAVTPAEALRLERMLRDYGFTRTGRHRNRKVERWQQGAINLVVNQEERGFAHSYNLLHGAAICALGLRVGDVDSAMARAEALHIHRFTGVAGEEGLDVPALRGVGGSLIYLLPDQVGDLWEREFIADEPPASGIGLTGIDHVAVSVDLDEFLSWQLYWSALFGLGKQEEQDILDPSGLVQSRAMETPDGTFRITMNAGGGRSTLASRFVEKQLGAGFQHLAFATANLVTTARQLAAVEAEILDIPANYYADLIARGELSPGEADTLSAHHLLLDVSADGGRYHQLYSRAFDRRFFFEIVERTNYRGFGARNAPVRLAAQARYRQDLTATEL
ncbi:bifunctional sugar phosphate isomerase/epimerase/4-hydroxyphenylpyruvate dioxygenase family protein [Sphingomonas psychrotolerans]|uniref:3-dehydroshikimate dehydratase n=1 Tax=Sphingomonas psychrotolerans TaxID=1327635 RepID=A0A2K8MDM0_9SPHN|nr:sugar phosphate isomerase/epimerase and 4-hydroxyphenylpyruvate domain-containing protein [Sphingomonas psychrotolerans]ATY31054.1 3-keto-5-aminohexanoate cleavage protein [Sphingomonas psychrotolerans]